MQTIKLPLSLFLFLFLFAGKVFSEPIKNANIQIVSVEIFSLEKNLKTVSIKSNCFITPQDFMIEKNNDTYISAKNGRLELTGNNQQEKKTLPTSITLSTYDKSEICLHSKSIKTHCYKGSIQFSNSENQLVVINNVPLKDYLYSVISGEIPAGWPEEAVKAQAIASHSYLLYELNNNNTIFDSTQSQFYGGTKYVNPDYKKSIDNVLQIIMLDSKHHPIEALFHSTCAGKTSSNNTVFKSRPKEYLKPRPCKYCEESHFYKPRTYNISFTKLKNYLSSSNLSFMYNKKGQLTQVKADYKVLSPYEFWLKLGSKIGWGAVPGIKFNIKCKNKTCTIVSRGAGHSVGLCQWGARGMALKGFNFKEILRYYYNNIVLFDLKKKEIVE